MTKNEHHYTELMALLDELPDGVSAVSLNPAWVRGLIRRLRKEGYSLRFWRGVYDDIDGSWVELTFPTDPPTAPTPTRKAHGTPPDTSMILGPERKAWLESHGGATKFCRDAIDAAMAAEQEA